MKLKFLRQFLVKRNTQNFMTIRPVGAELFHADRRTYMTKLIVAFRNFVHAPKNQSKLFREIIAVCSEIRTKHIHRLCRQNVEFFNAKPTGI